MEITVQQHYQGILDEMQDIVERHPYHAFALLSILIEVIGKSINNDDDWQHFEPKGKDFNAALTSCLALQKYQNIKGLYGILRCGMNHAFLPKEGIKLAPDNNDLVNNIIGCKELYDDIKDAWDSIITGGTKSSKDLSKPIMSIEGPLSSITSSTESRFEQK